MARPGGTKHGAGPNPYERKAKCVCDRPIPQREVGGVSCLKCGLMIRGQLAEPKVLD
jgi:hypothetical protein